MFITSRYTHCGTVSEHAEHFASHPRRLFRPRDATDRRGVPGRQTFTAGRRRSWRAAAAAASGVSLRGGRLRGAGDGGTTRSSGQVVRRTVALQRRVRRRLDAQLRSLHRLHASRLPVHPELVHLTVRVRNLRVILPKLRLRVIYV